MIIGIGRLELYQPSFEFDYFVQSAKCGCLFINLGLFEATWMSRQCYEG